MHSIMERIYVYMLENNGEYFKKQHISDEESKVYNAIRDSLTEKQKEAFDKFEELYAERNCESEEETFFVGFRMGARLAFEIMGLDFPTLV